MASEEELRQAWIRSGGDPNQGPRPGSMGQPPLASFHPSLRLLPNEALKALRDGGVNLENPSKDDELIINDLRKYNKLGEYPWPKPKAPATQGTPRDATTSPGTPSR